MANFLEVEAAASAVRSEGLHVNDQLALIVVKKVSENLDKFPNLPFGEILRKSLNDLRFYERDMRLIYAKVAGKYFDKRGGHKSTRVKKLGATKKQSRKESPVSEVDKNGQFSFLF